MMRRLPGWPDEELHRLLTKHHTPYFTPECADNDEILKPSDGTVSVAFSGADCGKCHVVSHNLI